MRHVANPDLETDSRRQMVDLLNSCLASALDLSLQAKHAHWNVDETAEAIGDLIEELVQADELGSANISAVTGQEHVQALAERMSLYSRDLKEAAVTASHLGDLATLALRYGRRWRAVVSTLT